MPSKICKRSDGTYRLSVAVGYDNQGKQIVKYKTVQARSMREAEREYVLFAAEVQKGEVAFTGKIKLSEFAKRWFEEHCMAKLAPKTQRSYKNHLNNRILPALGYLDINKIRPQHIISFLRELQERKERYDKREGKVSQASVCYSFRVLSSMMQDAVQWQIIPNNPCRKVESPAAPKGKVRIMDEASIAMMLQALEQEPLKYRVIILLAIDSGLRLGELMGLKWQDFELDEGMLQVTKSNQALKGLGIFTKSPKNESSVRTVMISNSMVRLLKQYHSEQTKVRLQLGEKWVDEGWLFTQWNGAPMYPTTPSQWFKKFLERNGLPHMRFHALRHLSATVLISQGVPLKNVSSRLGHADIRTTANIYGEALQSVDRQAAAKMDEFLTRTRNVQ